MGGLVSSHRFLRRQRAPSQELELEAAAVFFFSLDALTWSAFCDQCHQDSVDLRYMDYCFQRMAQIPCRLFEAVGNCLASCVGSWTVFGAILKVFSFFSVVQAVQNLFSAEVWAPFC